MFTFVNKSVSKGHSNLYSRVCRGEVWWLWTLYTQPPHFFPTESTTIALLPYRVNCCTSPLQSPQPPHFSPTELTTALLPYKVHNHHTSSPQSPQPPHLSPTGSTTTARLPYRVHAQPLHFSPTESTTIALFPYPLQSPQPPHFSPKESTTTAPLPYNSVQNGLGYFNHILVTSVAFLLCA